jgi:formylglycine-generating enzyme required for sulfatase activity
VQAALGALAVLLVIAGIGWLNQDYLKEQYYWRFTMKPQVLTPEQERALRPGDEFVECANGCPAMVVVPAGKFTMASEEGVGQERERPQHEATIAKPFAVSKYELTFAEWDACVATGDCPTALDAGWGRGEQPVINVNWDDAKLYVAWLAGAPSDGSAWIEGGNTKFRILRGGSWNMGPGFLTSTFRNHILTTTVTRLSFYGFRVAGTLDQ